MSCTEAGSQAFIEVPAEILGRWDLTPTDKIVLGYIQHKMGATNGQWPSIRDIAQAVGVNKSTVFHSIERLTVGLGILATRPARVLSRQSLMERGHRMVYNAVKQGVLKPGPCARCGVPTNGSKRMLAHHADYDKPLDIMWLCRNCHRLVHEEAKANVR
jgi:hypothetical protein